MTTKMRERDELEGILLAPAPTSSQTSQFIPLATVVADDGSSGVAPVATANAVAIEHFEDEGDTSGMNAGGEIPTAPALPSYDHSTDRNREMSESDRVRVGGAMGKALANAEMEDIDRAQRKIGSKQYHSAEAVRAANKNAQRRDREGLKITEDKYHRPGELDFDQKKKGDPDDTTYSNKKGGGYEISEYETTQYETKEYETSEYKSVYD